MAIIANNICFYVHLIHYTKVVLEIYIDILTDMNNNKITNKLSTKYIYKAVCYSSKLIWGRRQIKQCLNQIPQGKMLYPFRINKIKILTLSREIFASKSDFVWWSQGIDIIIQ